MEKETILIIAADTLEAICLGNYLSDYGYVILQHVSNYEAVFHILHNKRPDIIIMEVIIPNSQNSPTDIATEIYKLYQIPILFLYNTTDTKHLKLFNMPELSQPIFKLNARYKEQLLKAILNITATNKQSYNSHKYTEHFYSNTPLLFNAFQFAINFNKYGNYIIPTHTRSDFDSINLPHQNIDYIEAINKTLPNACIIRLHHNTEYCFVIKSSIKFLVKQFFNHPLIQAHKAFIVNNELMLKSPIIHHIHISDKDIPIGRKFQKEINTFFIPAA